MKIRKKPVVIEAVRFTGRDSANEIVKLASARRFRLVDPDDTSVDPGTDALVWDVCHSSWIGVRFGQWIVKGVEGEVYPIDDSVLRQTYDLLDEE